MKPIIYFLLVTLNLFGSEHPSIGIFTCKIDGVSPWDPDSVNSGITGSEEAVIYLSNHLADLGYQVTVYGNPPPQSRFSRIGANPRYVDAEINDGQHHDFAVAWRMPWLGPSLKMKADEVYLWPHDTIHYQVPNDQVDAFTDVFWLSNWQREQWISQNSKFSRFKQIFGNGVEPGQFTPVDKRDNPHSCIYGSNYARGLEILLDNWPEIKRNFPNASLDIYYGWQHFGLLSPEKEAKMRKQIKDYASLSVIDHERVGHEELNKAYAKASIWAYPCIAPETFCITALRAQASGAIPVIIEGTALTETVRSGYKCMTSDQYLATLLQAMKQAETMSLEERKKIGEFVFEEYTWRKIAEKWDAVFNSSTTRPASRSQTLSSSSHTP